MLRRWRVASSVDSWLLKHIHVSGLCCYLTPSLWSRCLHSSSSCDVCLLDTCFMLLLARRRGCWHRTPRLFGRCLHTWSSCDVCLLDTFFLLLHPRRRGCWHRTLRLFGRCLHSSSRLALVLFQHRRLQITARATPACRAVCSLFVYTASTARSSAWFHRYGAGICLWSRQPS